MIESLNENESNPLDSESQEKITEIPGRAQANEPTPVGVVSTPKHSPVYQTLKSQLDGSSECFYQAILEWLLHKPPAGLEGSLMIDDTDQISSTSVIDILMEFYNISEEFEKQKVIPYFISLISLPTCLQKFLDNTRYLHACQMEPSKQPKILESSRVPSFSTGCITSIPSSNG